MSEERDQRLERLCQLPPEQVPCQDDIRSLLADYRALRDAALLPYQDEAVKLRAERDRLSEALKEVHEWVEGRDEAGCLAAVEIIDRALASGEESR